MAGNSRKTAVGEPGEAPANTGRTRDGKGRWLKGAPSPNPTGRPPTPESIRQYWNDNSPRARARLVELVNSADEQVALAAAKYIVDRVEGKPVAALDVVARRGPDAGVAAGQPDAARRKIEELIAAASATGAAIAGSAEPPGIIGDTTRASNAESDSLDRGSPSENDTGDEPQRALIARSTDDEAESRRAR
jgi:hypothetical protein